MTTPPAKRVTVTVAAAADLLNLSTGRVFQLLTSATDPLDGPPSTGRGNGPRLVYEDTVQTQLRLRHAEPRRVHRPRPRLDTQTTVESLVEQVETLSRRLAKLERHDAPTQPAPGEAQDRIAALEAENRELQYAKTKSDAASDALRDALEEQRKATELRRRAETHDAAATAALMRAEKARDDAS